MRTFREKSAGSGLEFRFREPKQGILLKRKNRFLAKVRLAGREVDCFLANPARGKTLFRPGASVVVQRSHSGNVARKTRCDLLLVRQGKTWIMVDTRAANEIACQCLEKKRIPELAEYTSVAKEVRWGKSRFDFHLSGRGRQAYLEVKSVSLAKGGIARFPDGVTERGRRHVEELADIAREGMGAFVLFLVSRDDASVVVPNFAVDSRFSASLLRAIARGVIPLAYRLVCRPEGVRLGKKVAILAKGCDSTPLKGCYQLVIELRKPVRLRHPRFRQTVFPAGFYIYTGSGKANFLHRMARHLERDHKKRWHIDYLLAHPPATIVDVVVLPGEEQRECLVNSDVGKMPGGTVVARGFGSSDCRGGCASHLYWFRELARPFLRRLPGRAVGADEESTR